MKKYVEVGELLELFRDDEMLSCDRPYDVYQWAANIIEECPPANVSDSGAVVVLQRDGAERFFRVPIAINQPVWTPDGQRGVVDALYVGKNGIQRIFVRLENGERINLTPKGIGKDILFNKPL